MNCRQASRLLPLWIGQDLADASEAEGLQTHLSHCADCSLQRRQLQEGLDALQSISTASLAVEAGARSSVWPRLAAMLKDVPRRRDRFNGWIPAVAMALAATLMIAVSALQVHREMGGSVQASWGENRDLFMTDARFAPGTENHQDLRIRGLVAAPASSDQPDF